MDAQLAQSGGGPVVLVSSCKGEARSLRSGYKALARHLKAARCDVRRLDGGASGGITPAALQGAAIVVFGGPTQPFTTDELDCLRAYLRGGGSLLVLGGEAGQEGRMGAGATAGAAGASGAASGAGSSGVGPGTNINCLLEECGMSLATDCVIQTSFGRYGWSPPLHVVKAQTRGSRPCGARLCVASLARALWAVLPFSSSIINSNIPFLPAAAGSDLILAPTPTHRPAPPLLTGTSTLSKCLSPTASSPQMWLPTASTTGNLGARAAMRVALVTTGAVVLT